MKRAFHAWRVATAVLGVCCTAPAGAAEWSIQPVPLPGGVAETTTLTAAAFGPGSGFLLVGTNGTVLAAPPQAGAPLTLTSQSLPAAATTALRSATIRPSDESALISGNGGAVYRRTGAAGMWTGGVNPGLPPVIISGVASGLGPDARFVAVSPTIDYSSDGQTWTDATRRGFLPGESFVAVAAGDASLFAAVGSPLVRWSLDNGTTWQLATASTVGNHSWFGIAGRGRTFVAVGRGGARVRFTLPTSSDATLADVSTNRIGDGANLYAIASSADGYVAVGDLGTVWHSADGLAWEAVSSGTTNDLLGVTIAPADAGYFRGLIVLVGRNGTVLAAATTPPAAAVSATPDAVCFTGVQANTPLLTATGFVEDIHAVDWTDPEGTVVASNQATWRPEVSDPGTYRYRAVVRDLRTGALGEAREVAFTIHALPAAPIVEAATRTIGECDAGTDEARFVVSNPPAGGSIVWYDAGGIPVLTNATFLPTVTTAGTHRYSVRSFSAEGCPNAGEALPIELVITAPPQTPAVAEATRTIGECDAGTDEARFVVSNPPAGGSIVWYDAGSIPVLTNATFLPTVTTAGTHRYSVRSFSAEGCPNAGEALPIELVITAPPQTPAVAEATRTIGECDAGTDEARFVVSNPPAGGSIVWYDAGGIPVLTNATFLPTVTTAGTHRYSVRSFSAEGCPNAGEALPIELVITAPPQTPAVAEATRTIGECDAGTDEARFVVSNPPAGGSIVWYDAGGIPALTNATFLPTVTTAGTHRYSVRSFSAEGCPNAGEALPIELMITALPGLPVIANPEESRQLCETSASVTFTVTNASELGGAEALHWYNADGQEVGTGASYTAVITVVSTNLYTVRAVSAQNCAGAAATATFRVTDCPPILSIARGTGEQAGMVILTWQGPFALFEKSTVDTTGTEWTEVKVDGSPATSPYVATPSETARFYRLAKAGALH